MQKIFEKLRRCVKNREIRTNKESCKVARIWVYGWRIGPYVDSGGLWDGRMGCVMVEILVAHGDIRVVLGLRSSRPPQLPHLTILSSFSRYKKAYVDHLCLLSCATILGDKSNHVI
ncbi:hypothetical protein HKD37_16G044725 [Glycine soja]